MECPRRVDADPSKRRIERPLCRGVCRRPPLQTSDRLAEQRRSRTDTRSIRDTLVLVRRVDQPCSSASQFGRQLLRRVLGVRRDLPCRNRHGDVRDSFSKCGQIRVRPRSEVGWPVTVDDRLTVVESIVCDGDGDCVPPSLPFNDALFGLRGNVGEVRTVERAEALAGAVEGATGHSLDALPELLADASVLVNATSVGMEEDVSPVPADALHDGLAVLDAVYRPVETRLLRDAGAAGARTVDGAWMLLYQGVAAFERWTGRDAPVDAMNEALRDELE